MPIEPAIGHCWRSHASYKLCNLRKYGSAFQTAGLAGTFTVLAGFAKTVVKPLGVYPLMHTDKQT
jgi:hypothetical protein